MAGPGVAEEIHDYYTNRTAEADRLLTSADGRLELIRTRELLSHLLPPPPSRVLDVGGGPGVHASWLAAEGHEIELVDPIPRHIEQATQAGLTARLGDARQLDVEPGSYDVVLLLGPLYHLLERDERLTALTEAWRALRPGGLLAAAAINRYSSLFENTANTLLTKEPVRVAIAGILATGRLEKPRGFTTAYFHQPAELAEEAAAVGFTTVTVRSIEGPSWGPLKAVECHTGESVIDSPLFQAALTVARMSDDHPELMAAGSHLLATARKPAE